MIEVIFLICKRPRECVTFHGNNNPESLASVAPKTGTSTNALDRAYVYNADYKEICQGHFSLPL